MIVTLLGRGSQLQVTGNDWLQSWESFLPAKHMGAETKNQVNKASNYCCKSAGAFYFMTWHRLLAGNTACFFVPASD